MDYNEFLLKAQYDLAAAMPGTVISRETISKLQDESYEGLSVRSEGSTVGIMLNMEIMYDRLENGTDYNQILSDMLDIVDNNSSNVQQDITEFLSDYSQVKENLTVSLVGQDLNRDRLSDIPHYDMEDLSLIYRIDVSDRVRNDDGGATVLITNQLLKRYDVTTEQLHQDALANMTEKQPYFVESMAEVISRIIGIPLMETSEETPFYVASNPQMMFGASVIAYPDFMEQASEKMGGDFYIIPSSIHEVLLLKDDGAMDHTVLEEMIGDVNRKAELLPPEEVLSGKAYHYDSQNKVFELAEKFESRQQERADQPRSVLEELKSFSQKAERTNPEKPKLTQAHRMAL